jgi:MFS family permease
VYALSTIPTPLYLEYRRTLGFSELTLTAIYASYVLGNLAVLFFFGRLSDRIGRRPTTLVALGLAAVAALAFVCASSTAWLFAARIVSGLSAGLGAGALTAWIAELHPNDKPTATIVAAAFNLAGLGAGAGIAGVLAAYGPWPSQLVYLVYLVALAAIGALVAGARETVEKKTGQSLLLRPRIGVPKDIALAFVSPAATIFATFSLFGFYAAFAPGLLATSLHETNPAVAGAVVFELLAVGTACVVATKALSSRAAAFAGLALMFPTVGLLIAAGSTASMVLLLLATAVCGISIALGYRGSLAVINEIAPPERRAELVSSYLIAAYSGNALPVIGIGLLSQAAGAARADTAFAILICLIAALGLSMGARFAGPKALARPQPSWSFNAQPFRAPAKTPRRLVWALA